MFLLPSHPPLSPGSLIVIKLCCDYRVRGVYQSPSEPNKTFSGITCYGYSTAFLCEDDVPSLKGKGIEIYDKYNSSMCAQYSYCPPSYAANSYDDAPKADGFQATPTFITAFVVGGLILVALAAALLYHCKRSSGSGAKAPQGFRAEEPGADGTAAQPPPQDAAPPKRPAGSTESPYNFSFVRGADNEAL